MQVKVKITHCLIQIGGLWSQQTDKDTELGLVRLVDPIYEQLSQSSSVGMNLILRVLREWEHKERDSEATKLKLGRGGKTTHDRPKGGDKLEFVMSCGSLS